MCMLLHCLLLPAEPRQGAPPTPQTEQQPQQLLDQQEAVSQATPSASPPAPQEQQQQQQQQPSPTLPPTEPAPSSHTPQPKKPSPKIAAMNLQQQQQPAMEARMETRQRAMPPDRRREARARERERCVTNTHANRPEMYRARVCLMLWPVTCMVHVRITCSMPRGCLEHVTMAHRSDACMRGCGWLNYLGALKTAT